MASSNTSFKNRDDYRRMMELEEARKAGMAPAALDEDGKEINPHIPQYMTTAPWYMSSDGPTLKHQRNWNQKKKDENEKTGQWYERGAKTFQSRKYRKGACQNCGAMSHKTKDCMERPRAKGARWTNKDIAPDEKVQDIKLDYAGKRDRWNGYDSRDYAKVQQRYEKIENVKQEEARKKELEERFSKKVVEEGAEGEGEGEGGDFLLKDEEEAGFNKVEKRVRTTAGGATGSVRNLRIREDTAKYLLNLDVNSAHYDPKSRSMRADPNPDQDDSEKRFRGDAHPLREGEVQAWNRMVLHAGTSSDVHLQALPSQAELLFKDFKAKKEKVASKTKTNIEDKYGNAASKDAPDKRLIFGQTERYVEYNRRGQVVKGEEVKVMSRYEEDVFINNHKSVWGSWWCDGMWGYACCQSKIKNSYCVGLGHSDDYIVNEEAGVKGEGKGKAISEPERKDDAKGLASSSKAAKGKGKTVSWGEHDKSVVLDKEKVKEAMRKEGTAQEQKDERKRTYNSLAANSSDITPEEMEAYRLKKTRADDPMLKFM